MNVNRTDASARGAAFWLRAPRADRLLRARLATLALIALLSLGLALRRYRLGAQSLWLDEGSTWAEVTGRTGKGWGRLLAELFSPDAAYPLYHLLLRVWVALAGDGEVALRWPSALASALALLAVYLAARELSGAAFFYPLTSVLLLVASPFALWYAQEAKTYSLLLLTTAAQLWALLRALRLGTRDAWLLYLALALLSCFVHRLAILALVGGGSAYLLQGQATGSGQQGRIVRWLLWLALIGLAVLGISGSVTAVGSEGLRSSGHVVAGPLTALWLTFGRLSIDRGIGSLSGFFGWPASSIPALPEALGWLRADLEALFGSQNPPEAPRLWLLPTAALFGWGLWALVRDARRGSLAALGIVCSGAVPVLLFAVTTAFARLYEPRYMMIVLPVWALTLAYPFARATVHKRHAAALAALLLLALTSHVAALLQPQKGLFSGDPVKEQWREAVGALAGRAHPDDLVLLHPYYVQPLWDYYAPRVSADPLPAPVSFPIFGEGYLDSPATREQAREFVRREYEPFFDQVAQGRARALLLIAPEHARTVDPPKTLDELMAETQAAGAADLPGAPDEFGWLGLRFQFPQRSWPCGGDGFVGVRLMCQSFPELYGQGRAPTPQSPLSASFGGALRLDGYTLKPTTLDGSFRRGGGLPITLFWQALAPAHDDYSMFLHLCQDCEQPPVASDDAPPLLGHAPAGQTHTWLVGDPLHDERLLRLPAELAPGRYRLLLGVYPLGNPSITARLPVEGAKVLANGRLVLAEVEVR